MSEVSPRVEDAVRDRYAQGARTAQPDLCCPTSSDPNLLASIPDEVLERDNGCGDPTRYLRPGDAVLDLGSGAGKICFLACQVVGAAGKDIGVDMNDGMLEIARRERTAVCEKTFDIYSREPYRSHFELIPPRSPVSPEEEAVPFPCAAGSLRRDPKETKGKDYRLTTQSKSGVCGPGNGNGSCC